MLDRLLNFSSLILSSSIFFAGTIEAQSKVISDSCAPINCLPSSRFELSGDFIFWYSNQSGLGYTTEPKSTFTTSDFTSGNLVNPGYDWEPGFRLDFAYGFDQSDCSIGADFIWYRGSGSDSQNVDSINGLFPAFSFASDSLSSDYANNASIDWNLHFTVFDVLGLYEWRCKSYFSLISSLGLRNVWIFENAHAKYQGGTYQAGADIVHLKSRFYGIGPRLALKPQFFITDAFSFYAEGAGEFFLGWFDVKQTETFLGAKRASVKRDPFGGRWAIDSTVGFAYTYSISEKTSVSFDLGFDYLLFFSQNEFIRGSQFNLQNEGSDLNLYGGHASVGFCF